MTDVAFITTCKGRLHHLRQTLPRMVAEAPAEVVVVDYGCPQQTGNWVEANYPMVKVVRVLDDPGFCLGRARNIGARNTTSQWFAFIDADVTVADGFVSWMKQSVQPQCYYLNKPFSPELCGSVLVGREAFIRLDGYDEVMKGWGGEDLDLYHRLSLTGLGMADIPGLLTTIRHDDAERLTFYSIKNKDTHHLINSLYLAAKQQALAVSGGHRELPVEMRRHFMEQIVGEVSKAGTAVALPPTASVTFEITGTGWLPPPLVLEKKSTITLSIATRSPRPDRR